MGIKLSDIDATKAAIDAIDEELAALQAAQEAEAMKKLKDQEYRERAASERLKAKFEKEI